MYFAARKVSAEATKNGCRSYIARATVEETSSKGCRASEASGLRRSDTERRGIGSGYGAWLDALQRQLSVPRENDANCIVRV